MRLQRAVSMKRFSGIILIGLASASLCFIVDDISKLEEAKKTDHIVIQNVHVPDGEFLNLDNLQAGTLVEFEGRVTFGYEEKKGFLVKTSGTNVTLRGLPGHIFDCQGERWWDGMGGNGGKKKPKFIRIQLIDSVVEGLNVKNSPVHAFSINSCVNVTLANITLDNADGEIKGGHNTDGFDVYNSTSVRIIDSKVENQDDCLAVNAGEDILFENNLCIGGHGISIGSVGGREYNDVKNVVMRNCRVIDNSNGIRIKTNKDTVGTVHNVTFEDIYLENISEYGVLIRGNYKNSGSRGEATPGVPITGLTIRNVHGNVLPHGANVYINVANASDWTIDGLDVSGGRRKEKCNGIPEGAKLSCD